MQGKPWSPQRATQGVTNVEKSEDETSARTQGE